ncbi:MAG: MFS transporter [Actinobacteria bacterium]|nr:MFS transporter [Actinomycetota bacterium]
MAVVDAVTREPGPRAAARAVDRGILGSPWVLLGLAGLLLLAFGWNWLLDPTLSAPTRDPAWYTWRAELLMNAPPREIVQEWGPFAMFSGGYRVTVPLSGVVLQRVVGVGSVSFTTILMVGIPVLTSLTLAAFAFRHRRDPLLFAMTLLASGALFLSTPYVGYLDNLMGLYLLAMTLPFIAAARTSWGARSAVALFMFLATLTHPTTVAIYVLVLGALAGVFWLTRRLSIPRTLAAYGPMLVSAALGVGVGLAFWVLGLWGLKAPFADAALPPPYSLEVFRGTLGQWVWSLYPYVTFPLAAIAVAEIVRRTLRREGAGQPDDYHRMTLLWLLPLLGVLGFLLGLTYPYYRFMNTTLGIMLLVGLGAWVAARWLLRRAPRAIAVAGVLAVAGSLGFMLVDGLGGQWSDEGPKARWFGPGYRVPMASVESYAARLPADVPLLFVNDYPPQRVAWGWGKTFGNIARAGLEGDKAARTVIWFGHLDDFLAGRPSVEDDPIYDRVSRGFHEDALERLDGFEEPPAVFLVDAFNPNTENAERIAEHTAIGPGVAVVEAPGLAGVDAEAVAAARAAGAEAEAAARDPDGLLSDPVHLLRVLAVLGFLLVAPGLIAARWFGVEGTIERIALVPGLSIGLLLLAGVAVVAVTRDGFGVVDGWSTVALAVAGAGVLAYLGRRRAAGKAVVMPFLRRSVSLFSNRSFAFLMGAQFLALLGDGMVQASLAKVIAFGGQAGFDLEGRPPREILGLVLLTYLPYTLFSPFVGVLIDRYDRRKLLVLANGVRAVMIGLLGVVGLAVGIDRLGNAVLIVALLLTLAATRIVLAIKSAGIPNVLDGRDLLKGNATAQAGGAVFQVVGGAVALVGTSVGPASAMVLLGAAAYAVGTYFAAGTTRLEHDRRVARWREEVRRVLRRIWEGLVEVRRRAGASLGVFSFAWMRLQFSFVALVVALAAQDILGGNGEKLAVYIAAGTGLVGAVLGFVLAQLLRSRVAPSRLVVSAMALTGLGTLAFAALSRATGLAVVSFVTALGYFVGKVSADTIVQHSLADRFRGRGFSLFDIALNLGWILPAFVLWLVWESLGARGALVAAGVVFLAAAGVVATWARRIADQLPTAREEAAEVAG